MNYDVVVIGAGVIGCSCAYELVTRGYKVALVDKKDIASGTSSHCDACAMLTDKMPGPDAALGYNSIQRFLQLRDTLEQDFGLIQRGSLYICENEQEMKVATKYISDLQAEGYSVHMCDEQELHEREPFLAKDLPGGFWSDICCGLSPFKLCYAYVNQVKGKGLDVYTFNEVKGIKLDEKGAVEAVTLATEELKTKRVINCGGVWAPELGKQVGLDIPILPRKGVITISSADSPIVKQKVQEFGYMILKFANPEVQRDPELVKYNVAFTIEPTEGANFLLGSSRNFSGMDLNTEIEIISCIARRGIRFFPVLKDMNCVRTYAGVRPFVPDHMPIMSDVEEVPGYYICAGHEGDGIAMSPISGTLMAQLINGEETTLDMAPFRFSRFKENK